MTRAAWLAALRRWRPGQYDRTLKLTLISLAAAMTTDGVLSRPRAVLEKATGLPTRSLERHLTRAVEAGWLEHTRRGVKRAAPARYAAAAPVEHLPPLAGVQEQPSASRGLSSTFDYLPPATDGRTPDYVPLVAAFNKESERSEHLAVDRSAERKPTQDQRAALEDEELERLTAALDDLDVTAGGTR